MADIKLVISISEDSYKATCNGYMLPSDVENVVQGIKNGTPLPKGHGRLIDEERISLSGIHFETEHDHAMMIGRLNSAPTIIEADRSEEDEN